jgi:hypothetical protein
MLFGHLIHDVMSKRQIANTVNVSLSNVTLHSLVNSNRFWRSVLSPKYEAEDGGSTFLKGSHHDSCHKNLSKFADEGRLRACCRSCDSHGRATCYSSH